jgi:hypothetical protein
MAEYKGEFFWRLCLFSESLEKGEYTPHPDRYVSKATNSNFSTLGNRKYESKYVCPVCLLQSCGGNAERHTNKSHYPDSKAAASVFFYKIKR